MEEEEEAPPTFHPGPTIIDDMKKVLEENGITEYEDNVPFILSEYYQLILEHLYKISEGSAQERGSEEIEESDIILAQRLYVANKTQNAHKYSGYSNKINSKDGHDRLNYSWDDRKNIETMLPDPSVSLMNPNYQVPLCSSSK